MRNGVCATVQSGYQSIIFEGDNQVFIQAIKREVHIPWEIQMVVEDTKIFLSFYRQVYIQHIFREENRAADWLAKFGLSISSSILWLSIPCLSFLSILIENNKGRTLRRRAI